MTDLRPFPAWLAGCLLMLALGGCAGSTESASAGAAEPPDSGSPPPPAEPPPAEEPPPATSPPPAVSLSVADASVPAGGSTTLTWSATDASSCTASGGWSGSRALQGSAQVGPLDGATTFTLTCAGDGGSAVEMLSVSVVGTVSLSWQPPAENQDGSPATDLAGYRVYYGSFSRDYSDDVTVSGAATTRWDLSLPSGEYFIAMTAFDAEGNESAYSNEVVRVVD